MNKKMLTIACLAGVLMLNSVVVEAQTLDSGRNGVYHATHETTTQLIHTKLKVSFDFQNEQMKGEEWLTATPYFYPSNQVVLDAKAMLIHEVALDTNGKKKALKYEYANDQITIQLDKTYQKGQEYTLYISYTARPNEVMAKGSSAITNAKGLYFIDPRDEDPEKPTQIWTQGETESNSVWFPTIDKPNQKTTQEIYMTVPDKYVTLSNGILESSKKEANGLRTDHWVMKKKHAPYLFFMGVGDFAVIKDKWKNIDVDYYVEKEYADYAKQIFGNTPEMIGFFSELLGYEYPWAKYAQLVGRDYVSGAMENTTAVIHGESAQQKPGDLIDENRWEYVIAHELFHHWFGDLVTTESWSNLTVNESFANYSEYLWEEHKYGKDAADYHLMQDLSRYIHNPTDFEKDLVRFDYNDKEDMFDMVSYNKGGGILHMLRNYLGDKAFFAGLHDYLKTNEYSTGEAHQLRLSLEKVSGKDLNWFFNQWYFGSGNPQLAYNYSYDAKGKKLSLTIEQKKPYFQFPLTIDIFEGKQVVRKTVWVDAKATNSFTFEANQQPSLVNINADGVLLADIKHDKTQAQWYQQYTQSKEFKSRYDAVKAASENTSDANALKTLVAALNDPFFRIRMMAINALDLNDKAQAKAALKKIEQLATNDSKTLVQAAAIRALGATKDKKYLPIYEKQIDAVSNSVKASTLLALSETDPEQIKKLVDKIDLSNAPQDIVSELLPVIVENKVESQLKNIASFAAFYPFVKFQDPELGNTAEKAFNWIMEGDYPEPTQEFINTINQAKAHLPKDNVQVTIMIKQMISDAIAKKSALLEQQPNNTSVQKQVQDLKKLLEDF